MRVEHINAKFEGFFIIRDKDTGEILVDTHNAIHFGNMSSAMAASLSGNDSGHIRYMAFGNGGTIIDGAGQITYKSPNVSNFVDVSASLYNEIFYKEIDNSADNYIVPIPSTTTYTDVKIKVTLDFLDTGPLQDAVDIASDVDGVTVFDEMALFVGLPDIIPPTTLANSADAYLVTHATFHPVQKAANRILEVEYTVRIHLQ